MMNRILRKKTLRLISKCLQYQMILRRALKMRSALAFLQLLDCKNYRPAGAAICAVKAALEDAWAVQAGGRDLVVIVGQGRHSPHGRVVGPALCRCA